jgi:hypothetical protein
VAFVLIAIFGTLFQRRRQKKAQEQSKAKAEEQKKIRALYGEGNGTDSITYNFSHHHKEKWAAVEAGMSSSDFDEHEVPEDPSLPRPSNSSLRLAAPENSRSRLSVSLLRPPVSQVPSSFSVTAW